MRITDRNDIAAADGGFLLAGHAVDGFVQNGEQLVIYGLGQGEIQL